MDDQFNNWVDMWDKAQGSMPAVSPTRQTQASNSFFGMNSVEDDTVFDDDIRKNDIEVWKDVSNRTDQVHAKVDSESLFNEAAKKDKKKKAKSKPKTTKPEDGLSPVVIIKSAPGSAADSTGEEADPDEEEGIGAILARSLGDEDQFASPNPIHFASVGKDQKLRVTPNWTSGTALAALAKLKSLMYDLECEMLTAEALGGKNLSQLENRLEGLQKQFDTFSQKIIPKVKNDIY
jgi:hypothetical protein